MDTGYSEMLDKVITFVSDNLGIDKSKLSEQTKIEEDVGITGLDTVKFYETFFAEFAIENVNTFDTDRYITSENLQIGLFIKSLFSKRARQKLRIETNTIMHLTSVAMKRRWYEEKGAITLL